MITNVKFHLCAAAVVLIVPVAGYGQQRTLQVEEIVARSTPAVVLISADKPSGAVTGSGFLVDPSGTIVTNYHVMEGATAASVKLASGDTYERVSILSTDERRDLAIIKIAGFGLPTLQFGNSDSIQVGAAVIVIGSPFGLENTVSTGVMSGRRELEQFGARFSGFRVIQVSAPISRGSSGGPVLTSDGQVIGVATWSIAEGQNLNFAVPINYARGLLGLVGESKPLALEPAEVSKALEPVNDAISLDLALFQPFELEWRYFTQGRRRQTIGEERVAYRIIKPFGDSVPRIESHSSLEWRRPKARYQWRDVATANELTPVASYFSADMDDGTTAEYEVKFENGSVRGHIRKSDGRRSIDRPLPKGILQSGMLDVATMWLAVDSLVGRSFSFSVYDPNEDRIVEAQYTVVRKVEVKAAGETFKAVEVEGVIGADRWVYRVKETPPRFVLEAEGPEYAFELTSFEGVTLTTGLKQRLAAAPGSLEAYALDKAATALRAEGFQVYYVTNQPYDLRCTKGQELLYVLVKGMTRGGRDVLLGSDQVEFARENKPHMALYVVHSIKLTGDWQTPEITGGELYTVRPWNIDEGTLTPTGYSYRLP